MTGCRLYDFEYCRYLSETAMLIVAKRQETRSTRFSRARDLDHRPSVLYDNGGCVQSHHRWSLRGMECISQRRCDVFVVDILVFNHILSAAGAYDFLLFSHRLLATNQGNKTMSLSFM